MPHGLPSSKNIQTRTLFLSKGLDISLCLLVLLKHKELGVLLKGLLVHHDGDGKSISEDPQGTLTTLRLLGPMRLTFDQLFQKHILQDQLGLS